MSMFFARVSGPQGQEQFAQGFYGLIQPRLKNEIDFTSAAWVGSQDEYFVHGVYGEEEFPSGLWTVTLNDLGWQSVYQYTLRGVPNIFGLPLPGKPKRICDVPYNPHNLTNSDPYRSCAGGHDIANDHRLADCPVCGQQLV